MEKKFGPFLARSEAAKTPQKNSEKSYSKADSRYWTQEDRLQFHHSANYSVRLMKDGVREWFSCDSPNKKTAAGKAVEIWKYLQANGMKATREKYKPKPEKEPEVAKVITVGDVIRAAQELSTARRQSLDIYITAWRCIVGGISRIPEGKKKKKRRQAIDDVPLERITPAAVMAWKSARLRVAENDALQKRRTTVTVNSLLRNARALFARKSLPFLRQKLGWDGIVPFEGVAMEKAPSLRYVSRIDAKKVLQTGRDELMENDPEAYKVLVLGLICGLRRSEMDHLLWAAIDFERSVLRVESTKFHRLKSEDSAGEIDLDAGTVSWLKACREKDPEAKFVLEGADVKTEGRLWGYRCDVTFDRVLAWLRSQGVTELKPLHTLRKEIGSLIASEHDIFAASRYLRHSDIQITAAVYADKKKPITATTLAGLVGAKCEAAATASPTAA